MKRSALLLCGAFFLAVLTSMSPTAAARSCSLARVAGKYGFTSSGAIIAPPVGAFTAVGDVTFSETGAFSGAQTTSIAGNFFDETFSGTFSVNPDCTGTATVNVYHGATLARTTNLNLVWDDNEKEARAIFLTAGTAITINAKKMFREEED
jgi:hypothetical protein